MTIIAISGIVKNMQETEGVSEKAPTVKDKTLLGELWEFLKVRKAWWLSPIILLLLVAGLVIVVGSSPLSPFIYALF